MTKIIHVAVAILKKDNETFLLTSRPAGKPWAGWWEFPGGKIEIGELPEEALSRELQEEIGILPTKFQQWLQRRFEYPATHDSPAKTVHLHFFFVNEWRGELTPQEGQQLSWQVSGKISVAPILPANVPIMHALALPSIYAITNMLEMGETPFLKALKLKLDAGLQLIQVREKHLSKEALMQFATKVHMLAKAAGAKVMLNEDIALAKACNFDGVHLSSKGLLALDSKPDGMLVSASCHNAMELARAQSLKLDFVTLSPVAQTLSHPLEKPMGWATFFKLANQVDIPIFALGGMGADDMPKAFSNGARGIAMQRAIWQPTAIL